MHMHQEQKGTNYLNALVLVLVFVIVSTSFVSRKKKFKKKKYNKANNFIHSTIRFSFVSSFDSCVWAAKQKNEICLARDCGCRSMSAL